MAMEMMEELCGEDDQKWQEVKLIAIDSLRARIALWDGIEQSIKNRQMEAAIQ
jgi:hypothetical protein